MSGELRVIFVTGDRHWRAMDAIRHVLQRHEPGAWVIQGGATGADHRAEVAALEVGHQPLTMLAPWGFHGRKAGPLRNREMAKLLRILRDAGAEITAYAFHDDLRESKGTRDMVGLLDKLGIAWDLVGSAGAVK